MLLQIDWTKEGMHNFYIATFSLVYLDEVKLKHINFSSLKVPMEQSNINKNKNKNHNGGFS